MLPCVLIEVQFLFRALICRIKIFAGSDIQLLFLKTPYEKYQRQSQDYSIVLQRIYLTINPTFWSLGRHSGNEGSEQCKKSFKYCFGSHFISNKVSMLQG